jgi:peptide deformylase
MGWPPERAQDGEYTGAVSEEPERQEEEEDDDEPEQLDPERAARRRLALAQIRQYPDPVLRLKAQAVEDFDDDLRRLVTRMEALMLEAGGAGLAATQVGVLRRLFVFRPLESDAPIAIANGVITNRNGETDVDEEGCLSLQSVLVPVERAVTVTIEGKDATGAELRLELEGFDARVCQHELDHLDGVLMIDRTTEDERRAALGVLRGRPVLGVRP